MKTLKTMISLVALVASTTLSAQIMIDGSREDLSESETPEMGSVVITDAQLAGSGCRGGDGSVQLSEDLQSLALTFDPFVAEVGGGLPLSNSRKNCGAIINMEIPTGWTFTVSRVDLPIFAQLEETASAVVSSSFYFQGGEITGSAQARLDGPLSTEDTIGLVMEGEFASCDSSRALVLNNAARVFDSMRHRGNFSAMGVSGMAVYTLTWKRCGEESGLVR